MKTFVFTPPDETGRIVTSVIPNAGSRDTRLGRESSRRKAPSGTISFQAALGVKGFVRAQTGRTAFLFRGKNERPFAALGCTYPGHQRVAAAHPQDRVRRRTPMAGNGQTAREVGGERHRGTLGGGGLSTPMAHGRATRSRVHHPVMARTAPTRPPPMVCPSTTPWKTLHVIEPRMSALVCHAGGCRYLAHQFSGPHAAGNALAHPV